MLALVRQGDCSNLYKRYRNLVVSGRSLLDDAAFGIRLNVDEFGVHLKGDRWSVDVVEHSLSLLEHSTR